MKCRAEEKPRAIVSGGMSSLVDEQLSLVEKTAVKVIHFYRKKRERGRCWLGGRVQIGRRICFLFTLNKKLYIQFKISN